MKIKAYGTTLDIDDEAFFSWLMGEMLLFLDFEAQKAHYTVKSERVGFHKPRQVEVTINSACEVMTVGRLLKLDPLTHFTFKFPKLNAEATMTLMIYPESIDVHVKGRGKTLSQSGTYEAIIKDVDYIYKKCWDKPNVPVLYGLTCSDLLKMFKRKDPGFIETQDHNWPMFCNTVAKLVTCMAVAEPFRCLLMYPLAMMEFYLGKHQRKPLNPISNYTGSSSALVSVQCHFEAERRDEDPIPLTPEGAKMLSLMSDLVARWAETVLEVSKKGAAYKALVAKIGEGKALPLELLKQMVTQKILRHMSDALNVNATSIAEQMLNSNAMNEIYALDEDSL